MKKTTARTPFEKHVMELWQHCDEEMDRLELKGFMDGDNQPRMSAINEDDNIGADEVLAIGTYMALSHLVADLDKTSHLHRKVSSKVQIIGAGDVPEEMKAMLDDILKTIKKHTEEDK